MSFSTILTAAVFGMKAEFVYVEADVSNGLPAFHMVGYLSSEVKEAAERVQTAIRNSGFSYPPKRTIVNLSPATMRKRGTSFDLPVAIAILLSLGQIQADKVKNTLIIGEIGLDGTIRGVQGVLSIVLAAKAAGIKKCLLPDVNVAEGMLAEGIQIIGVKTLKEAVEYLNYDTCRKIDRKVLQDSTAEQTTDDYEEICGQEFVKRAVEVAVAGGHNLLIIGSPGSGKTMIAKRIPTIFPPLTMEESIEITKIYSILGRLDQNQPLIQKRPFRNVHHTATKTALIGGGLNPMPGEISLAHRGVLFLDELPEFQKSVLEVLRQPLEERKIRISRAHGNCIFPADFMLVAAMNPCPCGCYPDMNRCICTPYQIQNYLGKISQPFLDRIDICVEAAKVEYEDLKVQGKRRAESSEMIRQRVCRARDIQKIRYQGTGITVNAMLDIRDLEKYCLLGEKEERLMKQAFTNLGLTARMYHKILRVARTIADLEGCEAIRSEHIAEAVSYRTFQKQFWR